MFDTDRAGSSAKKDEFDEAGQQMMASVTDLQQKMMVAV